MSQDRRVRAATFNIRHGLGMDGRQDLHRTAGAIRALAADVVGLQEVDALTQRSGGVDQAATLGRELGMSSAFEAAMPFDGGQYGLAVLSRYPIIGSRSFHLPEGHEPRVAQTVDVRLPDGNTLTVVNIHFDWVEDDAFRFAQANAVAGFLIDLATPYVLLGDFNDGPESRTVDRFQTLAAEARKGKRRCWTFPASSPDLEIDFIIAGPPGCWKVDAARVVAEEVASDHRPVVADLELLSAER